jgi:large repetitive protein
MFRRHLPVALAVAVCLLGASSALADPVNSGLNEWNLELFGGDTALSFAAAAPTVQITSAPPDLTNDSAATFGFTATDAVKIECKLDAGGFEACTSPKSYSGLADGAHTFTVKATDTNHKSAEANDGWSVDTVAPTPSITQKPAPLANSKSASFSFTVNEPGTVECKLDAAPFETCTSPKSYANLAEGPHTFTVKATDPATNSRETSHQWTVDTVGPTTTIAQQPTNTSNDETPSFAFTLSEPAAAQCKLDGAAFTSCTSPVTYDAADGLHTFSVKATDAAGNAGPPTPAYTWRIDTVLPIVTLTEKPGSPSSTSSPTFVFSANEPSTFTCSLDHASPTSCSSPTTYTGLGDGPHSFAVTPTDAAGNTGPPITHDWTIETRAPTAAVTSGPTALSNSSSATFTFTADEPSSFDCKLDDRGFEACGSPASYHGLGDGPHAFSVRARDPSGNVSTPVAYGWGIDATAPETVLASGPQPGTATSASFAFSASEPAVFECRLDGAPFALCASQKSYDGLGVGDHRFEVRAIDSAGNVDATPVVHVWRISAVVPAVRTVTTTSALKAPKAGAVVKSPPLLVWQAVKGASYYNVQVYRGRRKVLSSWPTRPRLKLQARWKYLGRKQRLLPGVYRWYVWPGRGPASTRRYGRLLGQSTFTVRR